MFMGVIMYEVIYNLHPYTFAHLLWCSHIETDPELVCDEMKMNFPSTRSYPVHSARSSSQYKGTAP